MSSYDSSVVIVVALFDFGSHSPSGPHKPNQISVSNPNQICVSVRRPPSFNRFCRGADNGALSSKSARWPHAPSQLQRVEDSGRFRAVRQRQRLLCSRRTVRSAPLLPARIAHTPSSRRPHSACKRPARTRRCPPHRVHSAKIGIPYPDAELQCDGWSARAPCPCGRRTFMRLWRCRASTTKRLIRFFPRLFAHFNQ